MDAKNSLSNSSAVEIPQDTAVSLSNGLLIKPIEVENQKELDAMVAPKKIKK